MQSPKFIWATGKIQRRLGLIPYYPRVKKFKIKLGHTHASFGLLWTVRGYTGSYEFMKMNQKTTKKCVLWDNAFILL